MPRCILSHAALSWTFCAWEEVTANLTRADKQSFLGCQRLLVGPAQDCPAKRDMEVYLSTMETGLGVTLDWRRTAFWRESFMQARQTAHKLPQSRVGPVGGMDQACRCGLLPAYRQPRLHLHPQA